MLTPSLAPSIVGSEKFATRKRLLTWQGYPDYPLTVQEDLAMEAFIRGLTPTLLRQQVRLPRAGLVPHRSDRIAKRACGAAEEGSRDEEDDGSQSIKRSVAPLQTLPLTVGGSTVRTDHVPLQWLLNFRESLQPWSQ
ncbi:UNVERIFIED_CONTAM: hypothetical protein FKN15_005223 [Acipenser sinensis]